MADRDILIRREFINELHLTCESLLVYAYLYSHWNFTIDKEDAYVETGKIMKDLELDLLEFGYAITTLFKRGLVEKKSENHYKSYYRWKEDYWNGR